MSAASSRASETFGEMPAVARISGSVRSSDAGDRHLVEAEAEKAGQGMARLAVALPERVDMAADDRSGDGDDAEEDDGQAEAEETAGACGATWRAGLPRTTRERLRGRASRRSAVAGSVLHHPSDKLTERIARMGGHLGHQGRLGKAGLRVDFENRRRRRCHRACRRI